MGVSEGSGRCERGAVRGREEEGAAEERGKGGVRGIEERGKWGVREEQIIWR